MRENMNAETSLWDLFQKGVAYQSAMGLRNLLPRCVKFYEGDQWPGSKEDTADMPRPVVNIIKRTCRSKKSAILATPVRMVYQAETQDRKLVEKFNAFSDYIQKEYGQEMLDREAMHDGTLKGTYVYHYYWDTEAVGLDGMIRGGMRCELLDPLDMVVADPTKIDEQKQEWIIIATRESVRSVRAMVKDEETKKRITSDSNQDDAYGIKEQDEGEMVTVLTRYFRKDGEVYCEKATRSCVISEPFPIAPRVDEFERTISKKMAQQDAEGAEDVTGEEIDAPNNNLPDDAAEEAVLKTDNRRAPLYPIVVGQYEPRNKCIYGQGEVETLLPNQRAINNNIAMMLYNVQQNAWNKWIVDKNALVDQEITNAPGEVLIDYTGTGKGIQSVPAPQMAQMPLQLTSTVVELTRDMTGVTEVMSGETVSGSMSGAAIAQLQGQAMVPIDDLRRAFWGTKKKQGLVIAQFFRLFYHGTPFVRKIKEGDAEKYVQDTFDGDLYRGIQFDVVVETVGGSRFTNAGDITALDSLYAKGEISAAEYIEAYPEDALSNKQKILEILKNKQTERRQIQAMAEQMKQMQAYIAESQKAMDGVKAVLAENKSLKEMLAELYQESMAKITDANAQIEEANKRLIADAEKINELQGDAQEFAKALYAQMRASGGGTDAVPQM